MSQRQEKDKNYLIEKIRQKLPNPMREKPADWGLRQKEILVNFNLESMVKVAHQEK